MYFVDSVFDTNNNKILNVCVISIDGSVADSLSHFGFIDIRYLRLFDISSNNYIDVKPDIFAELFESNKIIGVTKNNGTVAVFVCEKFTRDLLNFVPIEVLNFINFAKTITNVGFQIKDDELLCNYSGMFLGSFCISGDIVEFKRLFTKYLIVEVGRGHLN